METVTGEWQKWKAKGTMQASEVIKDRTKLMKLYVSMSGPSGRGGGQSRAARALPEDYGVLLAREEGRGIEEEIRAKC